MDFVSTAVPPLIPGDSRVRNSTVDRMSRVEALLSVPTYETSALPVFSTVPIGTLVLDVTTGVLKFANTAGWMSITST